MNELAPTDTARLAELEQVVAAGLETFVDVGLALLEIRDGRLYRTTHETFDDYCRERWDLRREVGDRLIRAARVVEVLNPNGLMPANEAQTRELAPLLDEPELLRDAWAEASATGVPTAATVRDAVERRTLSVPLSHELLERQQRDTLINGLDRAVYALEGPPSTATAEARRLLAGGDAGPFTPSRFERVAEYATAFARALRKAGVDG
jgi:hypothetical protein